MGNKYLETKNDTLESSILDVWKDAAKLDEYKTRLGEKKRVAGGDNRRTENKQPKEEGLESSPNAANSQHLCAKNVVHEDWGEGQPVHGMHAIPNSNGDIAWYDVMFEHGVEKGVSINELKVTKAESHHDHKKKKVKENYDVGTPENTKAKLDATPGQSSDDWNQQVEMMQGKNNSMREALAKMWGVDEGHNPFEKKEGKQSNPDNFEPFKKKSKKEDKTMTGKPMTKVEVDPDMKEVKIGKKTVR